MKLDYLAHHLDCVSELASWHHEEWASLNPGQSLLHRVAELEQCKAGLEIPTTLVALEENRPLGSASLIQCDMDTRPGQSPWLASVFVAPQFRGRGIGSALVRRAIEEAARMTYPMLYLFTPDRESFYRRLGWETVSREEYRGVHVVVMQLQLT
jgi:predicted N-acetyltransferase YhbS